MRVKIRYTKPVVLRLGTVDRLTESIKSTGSPDVLFKHQLLL